MTESRRPFRRGRGRSQGRPDGSTDGDPNPYRDAPAESDAGSSPANRTEPSGANESSRPAPADSAPPTNVSVNAPSAPGESANPARGIEGGEPRSDAPADDLGRSNRERSPRHEGRPPQHPNQSRQNGRRPQGRHQGRPQGGGDRPAGQGGGGQQQQGGRRNRGRGGPRRDFQPVDNTPVTPPVVDGEACGWFEMGRDGGYLRQHNASYLAAPNDPFVPNQLVREHSIRRGDSVNATTGHDTRGRVVVVEVREINGVDPATAARRPDFGSLTATYPERKITLETGRPAKGGPELTRRAIDLVAPIGYGQRALIVAPARAGKTMLLHAITEGISINHPEATLLILLVDERPEEVSEAISWGVGEVIASSFDMPAARHVDVAEMVLEHARRLVEMGRDVVIVLDSLTRMARSYNTVERGTGRTMSGGLDSSAMAKPKAFFGSARSVAPNDGGGSLTIIATALVETGSRMDDVIFEEFKGTGNCEIKLDRSLAEKRIYPAIDIGASGTRREDKLFQPAQMDFVFALRRGLGQMPASSAMEWMIKRIAGTPGNDQLLSGL